MRSEQPPRPQEDKNGTNAKFDKIEQKVWLDDPLDNLRKKLEEEGQPNEYIEKQVSITKKNIQKAKRLHDAFKKEPLDVQEAKLKVKDSIETLKNTDPDDKETIEYFKKEIELNQKVVKGKKLVDVLDSMSSDEDKKRIAEAKKHYDQQKQL